MAKEDELMEVTTERVVEGDQAMVDVAKSRVAQEVQASMIVARRFPRDLNAAYTRIMQACRRKALAEQAMYAYPRGGQTVTGPSIRLAEVLVQNWGNADFGIVEVDQQPGESVMMAYAWDLETNTRQVKIFNVKHLRFTKKGIVRLTDPRDIYEMTANQGARRMRACILGIIPGDIIDAAISECEKTLASGSDEPIAIRLRRAVDAFAQIGVTKEMIEKRLGHVLEATNEQELVTLRKLYVSIKDNFVSVDSIFERLDVNHEPEINGKVDLAGLRAGEPPAPRGAPSSTPSPQAEEKAAEPIPPTKRDVQETLQQKRDEDAKARLREKIEAARKKNQGRQPGED